MRIKTNEILISIFIFSPISVSLPGAGETDARTINFAHINRHLSNEQQQQLLSDPSDSDDDIEIEQNKKQNRSFRRLVSNEPLVVDEDTYNDIRLVADTLVDEALSTATVTVEATLSRSDTEQTHDIINSSDDDDDDDDVDAETSHTEFANDYVVNSAIVDIDGGSCQTNDNNSTNNNESNDNNTTNNTDSVVDGDKSRPPKSTTNKNLSAIDEAARQCADAAEPDVVVVHNDQICTDKNHVCRTDIDRILSGIEENAAACLPTADAEVLELQTAIDELNASITRAELETALDDLNSSIKRVENEVVTHSGQKDDSELINEGEDTVDRSINVNCVVKNAGNDVPSTVNNDNNNTTNNTNNDSESGGQVNETDKSYEDQEIERLLNDDREELKRLTSSQIEKLFKLPESQDIYKQVESCYRAASVSPPPVPLETYRWEDVRRSKSKVNTYFSSFVSFFFLCNADWLLVFCATMMYILLFICRVAIHGHI